MPLLRDSAILDAINPTVAASGTVDADIDAAFNEGAAPIPPMGGYADFSPEIKVAVRQAYAQLLAAMAPTPWEDLTLQGSWTAGAGATPQYRRENFDVVRLRGTVTSGSTVIATLPAGFRPAVPCKFSVTHGDVTEVGVIEISTAGVINFANGDSTSVQLDGITFSTTPAG